MKGQAWAEYIIILAVIVMIAGIAMYMAGGFMGMNQQISERDSAAYWLSADVGIIRYYVNSSASQLVIKNNKNFRINVTAISSGGSGSLIAPGGANSIILDPGQSAQVNVTSLNCSGGVYSLVLTVNYTDARYGTNYSLYGEKPLVGLCTNYYAPPQCTSDADCSFNSSPCNTYCNASLSQLCTFATNPVICQRTCNEGKCFDCQALCGTASCTSCGTNTTNCPVAYCNGNQNCTYPPTTSCSIPCPVDACGSCNTPTCVATCTNCPPTAQICTGNGNCVACNNNGTCDTSFGENYTNCPADCCGSGTYACSDANNMTSTCRSGCNGFNCLNFKQVCDNQPWSASRCSNSTGGSSGSLDYYVGGCCNGTVYNCSSGTCNQTSSTTTSCIAKTAYYQSSTTLCGYYNGTSASCSAVNNYCSAGTYYPSQSCSATPTYTACQAETAANSCAICGNCAGGADTCNNVTCGTTNSYGCGAGSYCNGAKGAGSCNAPFATGAACNCSAQCISGVCTGNTCRAKYQSSTNLCGYYTGTSSSCGSATNYCTTGNYYPTQSCSATPTYTACQAETAANSCAVCGNCAGGSDTCNAVACGTTNSYGCANVCSGQGKGVAYCAAPGGTGTTCYCNAMCTSGVCTGNTCQAASPCHADCTYGDGLCHTACAGVNGCGTVQSYCEGIAPGTKECTGVTTKSYATCCGGTSPGSCSGSFICCPGTGGGCMLSRNCAA